MTPGEKHAERSHSRWAPSAAKRWMKCPGSVSLCEQVPPSPESPHAKEGTQAHEALELAMTTLKHKPMEEARKELLALGYPEDMVEHVVMSRMNLRAVLGPDYHVEQRVAIAGPEVTGSVDYYSHEPWGDLVIADFKYGAGVAVGVYESDNTLNAQLMAYAIGVAHKVNWEFSRVRLVIEQPRAPIEVPQEIWITDQDLRNFEKVFLGAIEASKKPDAPLVPSEAGCRWCPAKLVCPAVTKRAVALAQEAFGTVGAARVAPPAPQSLPPEKIAELLTLKPLVENWLAEVSGYALKLMQAGGEIPGFQLTPKRAMRKWAPGLDSGAVKQEFGDAAFETRLLSPAQFEKAFKEKAKDFLALNTLAESSGFNVTPVTTPSTNLLT